MNNSYTHTSLKSAEITLHNILEVISDGVWDWNALTGNVNRSSSWYRMLDYDINSLENDVYTWENLIHPEDYARVMKHFEEYTKGKIKTYKIKYRCRKNDGTYLWIIDSAKIVEYTKEGQVARVIGAHYNINEAEISHKKLLEQNSLLTNNNLDLEQIIEKRTQELKKLNKKLEEKFTELEYQASYDSLTNIFNRRKFEEIFVSEITRAKRYFQPLSIILLDIDYFKKVNDTYGHKTGDDVLISLSNILKNSIRSLDTLARWGGEEFIIILPNTSKENATLKAQKIRRSIEEKKMIKNKKITCSFGVTSFLKEDTKDSMFLRVDEALYLAKNSHRNNVKVL